MTFEDLGLPEDVRNFVREIDANRRSEPVKEREPVTIETRTMIGGSEEVRQAVARQVTISALNGNNVNPNVP